MRDSVSRAIAIAGESRQDARIGKITARLPDRHLRSSIEACGRASPGYCDNESQVIFGEGLTGAGDDIMVATKLGYFKDPADYRRPEALRRQIEEQVHEANWSAWWKDGGGRERIRREEAYDFAGAPVFEVLRDAKRKGLCRYIGITGNVAYQMTRVLRDVEVDTFLMAYNYDLILRTAEVDAIPLAREKNAVLILGAIFYAGRLVATHPEWLETPPDWMNETLRQRFAKLYDIQMESGLGMVELCVRFALAQPDASVVLVGTKTPAETAESVRAAEAGPLPEELQESIEALGLNMEG